MAKMLDPDFVFTGYDGTLMNKDQFLASIRDTTNQLMVEVSENVKLHRHRGTVVVTGTTHERGPEKGKHYEHRGRFTDTWMKQNGQWICITSHLGLTGK